MKFLPMINSPWAGEVSAAASLHLCMHAVSRERHSLVVGGNTSKAAAQDNHKGKRSRSPHEAPEPMRIKWRKR